MKVLKLDTSNFSETIGKATLPIIVDFYADWCGPCKMISPILEELAAEHEDILFCKVNVDDSPDIASQYLIQNLPSFISFKDGARHNTMVGVHPKEKILALVN